MKSVFKEIECFFDGNCEGGFKLGNQILNFKNLQKRNCELLEYAICFCIVKSLVAINIKYKEDLEELENNSHEDESILNFVEKLLLHLNQNDLMIVNVVIHLTLQHPKLCRPEINHKFKIRDYLENTFKLQKNRVVVHAGTGERIGKTGNSQSIIILCTVGIDSIQRKRELFAGFGFDRHRFEIDLKKHEKQLTLSGQKINYHKSIDAHSDGDVILHAAVNAIFSAIGLGDIGEHFPDTHSEWKNANSVQFLNYAMERLRNFEYRIVKLNVELIVSEELFSFMNEKHENFITQSQDLLSNFCQVKSDECTFMIRLADGNQKNRDELCIEDDLGTESRIRIIVENNANSSSNL